MLLDVHLGQEVLSDSHVEVEHVLRLVLLLRKEDVHEPEGDEEHGTAHTEPCAHFLLLLEKLLGLFLLEDLALLLLTFLYFFFFSLEAFLLFFELLLLLHLSLLFITEDVL